MHQALIQIYRRMPTWSAQVGRARLPNATPGMFSFNPATAFVGDAVVVYSVRDTGDPVGTLGNMLNSAEARVVITVLATASFVDANNNKRFDAGVDVALTRGEISDGVFDTQVTEGGYTRVIAGAGLVIPGSAISTTNIISFRAAGILVINANLSTTQSVTLTSVEQDVLFDVPTIMATSFIRVSAKKTILSAAGTGWQYTPRRFDRDRWQGFGRSSRIGCECRFGDTGSRPRHETNIQPTRN